ncbi:MAG: 3'-5' exonuclease, partial [Clostridia bacterium]
KKAYEALQIDDKKFPHKMILSSIGRLKDQLLSPAEALEQASDFYSKIVANVYEQYQKSLYTSCAMDFDDIIMQTVKLFTEYPHILQKYQSQFKYILVDEYQDTNKAQFVLVSLLAAKPEGENRNICVVGDDDQSIYKFRGATVENILNFEDVFDNATVIKLEENYRCTQPILDAANSVIANNTQRKEKSLWTSKDIGEKVLFIKTQDEIAEAEIITGLIKQNFKNGGKYSDNAILYRMNAQSNTIEKTFARRGIPYKIFGGLRFYDRKEIKDMLAYLWLIVNPDDNIRLLRVINEPKRGIGQTTIDKITQIATENNLSVFNVIKHASSYSEIESRKKLFDPFVNLIENLQKVYLSTPLDQLYDKLLEDSGYANSLLLHGEEGETRLGNIKELKTNILEYLKKEETKINNTIEVDEEYESFSMDKKSSDNILESFLSEVSLATELDNYDEKQDYVSMMTIHSAKGLEFKNIFLPAIEETIFPSTRSVQENDIEEERRLAYVAITRAKENLYIINARKRIFYGKTSFNEPSRFINEINPDVIEIFDQTKLIQDENLIRNELKPFIIDHSVKDLNKYASKSYYPQKNSSSSGFSVGKSSSQTKPKPTFGTHNIVAGAKQTEKKIFLPGDGIEHKKFGNGIVKMAKPMGNDTLIEVEFADGTIKKIMANLAPIEKI